MMEFYDYFTRKARKKHRCEFCEKDIMPGERYSYEVGSKASSSSASSVCHAGICWMNIYKLPTLTYLIGLRYPTT